MLMAHIERVSYPNGCTGVRGVKVSLDPGEILLLVGPSGSGKSTLLKALGGIIPYVEEGNVVGRVVINGVDVSDLRPGERPIAYMPQNPSELVLGEYGYETILLYGGKPIMSIDDIKAKPVSEMSSGQLQRLVLSSIVGQGRCIVLLDEPLANLDIEASRDAIDSVKQLASHGISVIVAEHRVSRVAKVASKILVLDKGRPVYYGEDVEAGLEIAEKVGVRPASPIPKTILHSRCGEDMVVVAEDVWVGYGGKPVLRGACFTCKSGQVVAVIGPNGSGKTTLLRTLAGLLRPWKGKIGYGWGNWHWKMIGYVPPNPWLGFTEETVYTEVYKVAMRAGVVDAERKSRELLETLGLQYLAERSPWELSGGEKVRLAIAKMAVKEPRLFLLDEPFRGQDRRSIEAIMDILEQLAQRGSCCVVVTHDVEFLNYFDTVYKVVGGKVELVRGSC